MKVSLIALAAKASLPLPNQPADPFLPLAPLPPAAPARSPAPAPWLPRAQYPEWYHSLLATDVRPTPQVAQLPPVRFVDQETLEREGLPAGWALLEPAA